VLDAAGQRWRCEWGHGIGGAMPAASEMASLDLVQLLCPDRSEFSCNGGYRNLQSCRFDAQREIPHAAGDFFYSFCGEKFPVVL
jgi:hypothetical protein